MRKELKTVLQYISSFFQIMVWIVLQHFLTADYNHNQIWLPLTDELYNIKEKQKQRTIKSNIHLDILNAPHRCGKYYCTLWSIAGLCTMLCRNVEEKRYSFTYYLPCYYMKLYGQWHGQPLHCQGKSLLTNAIAGTTQDRQVAKALTLTENGDLVGQGQLF